MFSRLSFLPLDPNSQCALSFNLLVLLMPKDISQALLEFRLKPSEQYIHVSLRTKENVSNMLANGITKQRIQQTIKLSC